MKYPMFGLLTDVHIKANNSDLILSIFQQFIDLLNSKKIKFACFLGDLFTERQSQDIKRLTTIQKVLNLFNDNGITLFAISGNHDKLILNESLSYLSIYEEHQNFIHFPIYNHYDLEDHNIRLHFISYFIESEEYMMQLKKAAKNIKKGYKNVLLTHIAVQGARNNDGSIVEEGGVEVNAFRLFDLVLSGHYHDYSFIKPNIHYIRSAYQSNYGETEEKGFVILNSDLTMNFHQSKFIKYKKLKVPANNIEALKEIYEELKKVDFKHYNVRLLITGSQYEIESVDVSSFKELGVDVKFENNKELDIDFENIEDVESISMTKGDILKNYITYSKQFEFTTEQRNQGLRYLKELQ